MNHPTRSTEGPVASPAWPAELLKILERYEQDVLVNLRAAFPGLGGSFDWDDIWQETTVAALQAFPTFEYRSDDACCSWLRTLAINTARGKLRGRLNTSLRNAAEPSTGLALSATSPSGAARKNEVNAAMQHCIEGLPPGQKTVMQMVMDNHSYANIASRLGIPENAVRQRYHQALKKLNAALAALGVTASAWPNS